MQQWITFDAQSKTTPEPWPDCFVVLLGKELSQFLSLSLSLSLSPLNIEGAQVNCEGNLLNAGCRFFCGRSSSTCNCLTVWILGQPPIKLAFLVICRPLCKWILTSRKSLTFYYIRKSTKSEVSRKLFHQTSIALSCGRLRDTGSITL